jgi:membrane protein
MARPMNDTNASSPAEISQRGWRDVLRRSCHAMSAQNMSLSAAGIAFYMVWAFFPALAIIVILSAFLLGPGHIGVAVCDPP